MSETCLWVAGPVCEWRHATACGHAFDLDSGGDPLIFCPFCGKKIATGLARPVVQCLWVFEGDGRDDQWNATCGTAFIFGHGGPEQNSFHFCPFCGGALITPLPKGAQQEEGE
jgi:rRNA maturation endonuclease Nob1